MDPNEALANIRNYAAHVLRHSDDVHAVRLAEHARALDEWLSKGGFAPKAWQLLDVQWRDVVGGPPEPAVEHGLDWKDLGHAYQGRCECGQWVCGGDTLVELLALYDLHLRGAGVPDHRKSAARYTVEPTSNPDEFRVVGGSGGGINHHGTLRSCLDWVYENGGAQVPGTFSWEVPR
jgi:hypothetical protein